MAELGRVVVRDPDSLLPGGFWAAVAVWVERPQVANKRLCGVRLEARRSASLPRVEHSGPRPSSGPEREEQAPAGCGPKEGPGHGRRFPEGGPGTRPSAGPEHGPQESQGRRQQGEDQREAAKAPLLSRVPGQPGKAGAGEGDFPASDLDSLWDDFSRSLASGNREMLAFFTRSGAESQLEAQHGLDVILRTVIPKTNTHCPLNAPRREIVVQDVLSGTVTFLPLEEDNEGNLKVKTSNVYQIQLSRSEEECSAYSYFSYFQRFISVLIFCPERWHSDGIVYPKPTWLGEELLARLARWCVESRQGGFKSTLSLISIMKYSRARQALKEKYKDMVKVWPEVTDPEKFVYEDVALAAYLLILWEEERAERGETARQSFVDLGCGNGLLVHILSSEGHPGRGIDVRRRKVWDVYGPETRLEESAIIPNDETLFPDVDWLIGNHSDELTPWIPVIAARSSYNCRFFVLPCCFFDFVGKYQRRQSQKTQYRGYLDFITEVGSACGFHVEEDCLRIPSTKRLSKTRGIYSPEQESSPENVEILSEPAKVRRVLFSRAGSLSLAEVAGELDRETLRRLKRECGGLQTLLRNSSQVFQVLDGRVRIRDWREERPRKEKEPEAKRRLFSETFKTRICWFFAHHPDGCVLPSDRCPFAHGPGELRPASSKKKRQPL
ncbi:probable tRNA (uracil-O(2)-)-methyltransferase isoform X3 [Physeter macrocephalus]|uniref:tRNA (uracil-O(2)-)-methyltransferase n=1 Tax=Physeter macrocephalus TaxID=9755 RepID=A0A9W2WT98_PHYMC|nr:probable tRNA (uracil-O(2)-)-methyltransferase isoform X3 [Physeter catodon]